MTTCQHCSSTDLHWFTPITAPDQGSIVLCRRCGELSVRTRREARHATPQPQLQVAA
jgi:hypothetical protein